METDSYRPNEVGASPFRKIKRFILPIVGILLLFFVLIVLSLALTRGQSMGLSSNSDLVPGLPSQTSKSYAGDRYATYQTESGSGYIANLEDYETNDYQITARTKSFEHACSILSSLKRDTGIHFKNLTEGMNSCSATFFVSPERSDEVLKTLTEINGSEVTHSVTSVTKQKEMIVSEKQIIKDQLAIVEQTFANAQLQYDEIIGIARRNNDANTLTTAINSKLQMIGDLSQKRIQLSAQLEQLDTQATELSERIGNIAFSVTLYRSYALDPNKTQHKWESAWELLHDQWTTVLIGFTAYLGVFILRVLQIALYAIVAVFVFRYVWRIVRRMW